MARLQHFQNLSIIIPTLNEASSLPLLFADLNTWTYAYDLIVVDGGSKDLTSSISKTHGANVIKILEKNRGHQLKIGASVAKGEWLLFLHADSRLDPSWGKSLLNIMDKKASKNSTWYFDFKIRKNNLEFRVLEIAVAFRSYFLQRPYGDQGMLIHKDLYNSSGGFSSLKIMEDLDLITRITKTKRARRIRENIYTNDRRWVKSNVVRRAIKNAKLRRQWRLGQNIDNLSKEYYS